MVIKSGRVYLYQITIDFWFNSEIFFLKVLCLLPSNIILAKLMY